MKINNNTKEKIKKINEHIKTLEIAYNNTAQVLKEDLVKDDDDKLVLKDSQKKVYAEGVKELSETLEYLLGKINENKNVIYDLENPESKSEDASKKEGFNPQEKFMRNASK